MLSSNSGLHKLIESVRFSCFSTSADICKNFADFQSFYQQIDHQKENVLLLFICKIKKRNFYQQCYSKLNKQGQNTRNSKIRRFRINPVKDICSNKVPPRQEGSYHLPDKLRSSFSVKRCPDSENLKHQKLLI